MKINSLKQLRDVLERCDELEKIAERNDDDEREELLQFARANGLPTTGNGIDTTALPVFGGPAPTDTAGIWSWDEQNILLHDPAVADGRGHHWTIEERESA